ncbi:MAG: SusF/SusE family outer membrane protein [Rikenellaceae bacterium]|nr:SusF/SusE family outer membrane protein [Rikenellaceae bacterium]
MKTNKLIAAALLPLLFSCAKESIEPTSQPENSGNYLTINVSPSNDAITRATYDDNDGIIWQTGGKAGIFCIYDDYYIRQESEPLEKIYPFNDSNNNKESTQASFRFNLNAEHHKCSFKFFYPYHSDVNVTTGDNPYIRIPFSVDPNQTSGVGKSSDNFAVVSKEMLKLDPKNLDTPGLTYYKVVGSYIRFLVYGKPGEKVKSISIKSAQKPSGLYFVNGGTNVLNGEPYANEGDIVTVSVSGDYITPETISGAKGIYASVLPERALKNTYTVVTDKGLYEFESKKEAVFKFGYIMDVPLNLENAKCKYTPAELYIVGDACESGWDASKAVAMTKGENNTFTAELFLQKGEQGFKLLTRKGIYEYCYVNDGNGNMVYYNNPPDDADKKFNVDCFALYKVTADFNTGKLTCEALAPYLVSDFTSYHFGGQDEPLQMKATDTPGVFKAEKVRIYNKSYQEGGETKYYTNAFKFAFKKTDGKDIDYTFSIQPVPVNDKNVEIVMWKETHDNGTAKVDALSKEFSTRLVGKLGNIGSLENNIDKKWMVEETYNNKYYDITLDLVNNKMTLSLSQGSTYKLVGINFISNSNAPSATVDGNGCATWTIDVDTATKGWDGTFKICGENTISQNSSDDSFWEGEWYYSQLNAEGAWWWNSLTYGSTTPVLIESSGDRKWKMTEYGNYTIVFDTKNLTLKVTKNN